MDYKNLIKTMKLNEGIFNKLIQFLFMGDIDKVTDNAKKNLQKVDPKFLEKADKHLKDYKKTSDKANAMLKEYCSQPENYDSNICKQFRERGGDMFQLKWKKDT